MKTQLAIISGKTISLFSKFLKLGGGSAAPGLFALRIDPELVEELVRHIPQNIVITGTNGKTTTARMLAHFAQKAGLKIIRNHTGSNLERGIASALIANYKLLTTNYQLSLGIWELDEAAFNLVAPKLNPNIVVFLNVFRDQLDRYGEIDTVVKNWNQTLKKLPSDTTLIVNGDDNNTAKLKESFKGKVYQFGVKDYQIIGEGIFSKKMKSKLDFVAKNVKLKGLIGSSFSLHTPYSILHTSLPLPGIYHIYDFLAAFAVSKTLGLDTKRVIISLKTFSPAFGRVEKLDLPRLASGKTGFGYIFLIKNPAGATQVFETIAPSLKKNDRLLLALNDNLADGTDVSWIWDGEFERLTINDKRLTIYCSGTRAYDLANRLKYSGWDSKNIIIEPNLEKAFYLAKKAIKGRLFVLPTYTAMIEFQSILVNLGIKKHYWEEN